MWRTIPDPRARFYGRTRKREREMRSQELSKDIISLAFPSVKAEIWIQAIIQELHRALEFVRHIFRKALNTIFAIYNRFEDRQLRLNMLESVPLAPLVIL